MRNRSNDGIGVRIFYIGILDDWYSYTSTVKLNNSKNINSKLQTMRKRKRE